MKSSVWSQIKYGDGNYHIMINDVREHLKAQKVFKKKTKAAEHKRHCVTIVVGLDNHWK